MKIKKHPLYHKSNQRQRKTNMEKTTNQDNTQTDTKKLLSPKAGYNQHTSLKIQNTIPEILSVLPYFQYVALSKI